MSWITCDICSRYEYAPTMVKFTSVSGVSLVICNTCLEVAELKKKEAVFWLPEVTHEDVKENEGCFKCSIEREEVEK